MAAGCTAIDLNLTGRQYHLYCYRHYNWQQSTYLTQLNEPVRQQHTMPLTFYCIYSIKEYSLFQRLLKGHIRYIVTV